MHFLFTFLSLSLTLPLTLLPLAPLPLTLLPLTPLRGHELVDVPQVLDLLGQRVP